FQLWDGDSIIIYGDGPVGLSFVKFARLLGLDGIYLIGKHPDKLQKAIDMGATAAYTVDDLEAARLVEHNGRKFDAVIDAVGKEDIINAALPLIKLGGSVCVYGAIGRPAINLQIGAGPFNFNLLVHQWPTRFRERAAQEPLIALIRDGKLSYTEFVSAEFPVQQVAEAFAHSKATSPIKTLLRY
ncbi:MAG: zinc-binding dehydrogenase, partial [Burkholderiales bacterium]|nr:zinc-binding dehydrogenase [Anaerolineae bacterium]